MAQTLIGACAGSMRLAHRALEMHAVEVGYRADAWVERAIEATRGELSCPPPKEGLPVALEQARLATLALTRATASTASQPMLVPGHIADALGHLLLIYVGGGRGRRRGMRELLLAVLERLPSRVRRFVVAGGALLALAAVMAALTLSVSQGDRQRQPARQPPGSVRVQRTSPHRLAPPVSTEAVVRARRLAERFLAGYLPFAYGRGGALAINGITSALRQQQLHKRSQLTPVERRRRPRVVSLQTTATTPMFVVATAVIDDGGVTIYRLRFTLDGAAGRWLVSGVQEG